MLGAALPGIPQPVSWGFVPSFPVWGFLGVCPVLPLWGCPVSRHLSRDVLEMGGTWWGKSGVPEGNRKGEGDASSCTPVWAMVTPRGDRPRWLHPGLHRAPHVPKCGSCLWGTERPQGCWCLRAEPLCPRGQGQGLHELIPLPPPRVPVTPKVPAAPTGTPHPRGCLSVTPPKGACHLQKSPSPPKGASCPTRMSVTSKGAGCPQRCPWHQEPSRGAGAGGHQRLTLLPPRAAAARWPEPYNFSFFLLKTNNLFLIK